MQIWQAKRILWNNYNFGGNDNTANDQLKIDVGVYNQLLGKSYGEIAAESRSMHKSQGFGSAKQRGSSLEYFSEWKGGLPKTDLMEGVKTGWDKIINGASLSAKIAAVKTNFDAEKPGKSLPELLNIYQSLTVFNNKSDLITDKINELKDLILECSGTWFEAYSQSPNVAINTPFKIKIEAISQQSGVSISSAIMENSVKLLPNKLVSFDGLQTVKAISQPYWLQQAHEIGRYKVAKQNYLDNPEGKAGASVLFVVNINGINLNFERPVVYKYTDQVRGEIYQPLAVTPPVTATLDAKAFIFNGNETKNISIKLKAFKDNAKGTILLTLPTGWIASPEKLDFDFKKYGEEVVVDFKISATAKASIGALKASVIIGGESFSKGIKVIDYQHIPTITYFPEAEAKLIKLDLKTGGKNIGYIAGAGDLIPEMLKEIGFNVTMLSENEIMNTDLSKYDAIIAGIRAYNVNDRLKFEQPKLMQYVENGGVYLVQYNVNRPLVLDQIGPYPFVINRDRVTEEDAVVNILEPNSKALNFPNKITSSDFEDWIQERGIYFATNADSHYEKPLSMKDSGETASDGSLLIANYGKGKFIYTGLVFFRELPAGNPGAYRLFVNLIAK